MRNEMGAHIHVSQRAVGSVNQSIVKSRNKLALMLMRCNNCLKNWKRCDWSNDIFVSFCVNNEWHDTKPFFS